MIAVEIARNAPFQVLRFAHVNDGPMLVEVLVTTWRLWEALQYAFNMFLSRTHLDFYQCSDVNVLREYCSAMKTFNGQLDDEVDVCLLGVELLNKVVGCQH